MPHLRTSVKMRPFRPSALPVRALKIMEPTVSLPAAVLFLAGAVVTWIVFDTEPPADDLRSLVGFFGFVAIRCALLGSEDLANNLCAERGSDAVKLDHARLRFILECRAIGIEPIDAPYTFSD